MSSHKLSLSPIRTFVQTLQTFLHSSSRLKPRNCVAATRPLMIQSPLWHIIEERCCACRPRLHYGSIRQAAYWCVCCKAFAGTDRHAIRPAVGAHCAGMHSLNQFLDMFATHGPSRPVVSNRQALHNLCIVVDPRPHMVRSSGDDRGRPFWCCPSRVRTRAGLTSQSRRACSSLGGWPNVQ